MMNNKSILPDKKVFLPTALHVFVYALPFLLMDAIIRIHAEKIKYFQAKMVLPSILFTAGWIFLFVCISLNLKGKLGKIVYSVIFGLFFLMFITHCVYFPYTGFFFSFNLLLMASEGSAYILETLLNAGIVTYLLALLILGLAVFAIIKVPKKEKTSTGNIIVVAVLFTILHLITPLLLGKANDALKWDNWRNPRNVYQNFNDSNKNIKICGLYEYTLRDFYMTFLKPAEKEDPEELAFLADVYSQLTPHTPNKYTGTFEGKNVIFLQLEGIDSWLLNPEDTPTLYSMLGNSLVFKNHYSYYNGGGSTFNSELAVNTGFITPISYTKNAYSFSSNLYRDSLPRLFKQMGYHTNAFHMNTGEYYSRELNYKNWGYDAYYGLMDVTKYNDASYELDRELILNKTFYEKMFLQEGPFMHYVITYTPHTPFSLDSKMGSLLAEHLYEGQDVPELSEEECARLFAAETDYMVELMLQALEENGLLENTVIVAFSDHYLYTLKDKTILDQYKETSNNLINQTPFFIWSHGMTPVEIGKVNSQIDILPTVLNLFGIQYTEEFYIGRDIFDPNYGGYAFFSDYSWYDGNVYVENGTVTSQRKKNTDEEYILQMNALINSLIQQNDLTLKYDYLRRLKK